MSQSLWQRLFNHRQQTKQAVLILGSGRSGTSVMTKCVNLMGISLGTDNLLAPSKRINPKGYFENKDVINIHKSLGSRIRYRPAFKGYYDSPKIKKDRAALTTYLRNFFARPLNSPRGTSEWQSYYYSTVRSNLQQPHDCQLLCRPS